MRPPRLFAAVGALVAMATTTPAQQPAAPARDRTLNVTAPTGTAGLAGIVRDEDGHGLRRATVTIAGDMRLDRSTITDDAGRFVFAELPAGRFTVTATKGGYPRMSYGAKRPFRAGSGVLLGAGQQVTDLALTLSRGAVLTGTVYDDRGQPMPGVPIMAYEVVTALGGERSIDFPATGGSSVATDDRGTYRLYGLPPGEYTAGTAWFYSSTGGMRVPTDAEIQTAFAAMTQAPGGARTDAAATPAAMPPLFNYTPVYYSSSVDITAAQTVTVGAGDVRDGLDIHMQFRHAAVVEGTIVSPGGVGDPTEMALIYQSSVAAMRKTSFWSAGPDGKFRTANLMPGDYTILAVTHPPAGQTPLWASADLTVTGTETEPIAVTLTVQPSMTASGQVAFDGQSIKPPADLSRVRVSLVALEGTNRSNGMTTSPIGADGKFTVTSITPGQYRVLASVPGAAAPGEPSWSLKSVVVDGRDATDLPIEIGPGSAPSLTVTFTDQSSELSGRVTTASGAAATDFFVVVLPSDERYWGSLARRVASVRPDASGRYIFRSLPPGAYRIAAVTDLAPGDLNSRAGLLGLLPQSAAVTVALGEKKMFDIQIQR